MTKRLRPAEVDVVEDHLLLCERCQRRYVAVGIEVEAIRVAARRIREQQPESSGWFAAWGGSRTVWAAAAMAAALVIGVPLALQQGPPEYQDLVLAGTTRSASDPSVAARNGLRPRLTLRLDGIEETSAYEVHVVDARGRMVWKSGTLPAQGNSQLNVTVEQPLRSGQYWVRVNGLQPSGRLLREYPLAVR